MTVSVATITRQDFKLEIGAAGEVVTIQSSDIQVETQTGADWRGRDWVGGFASFRLNRPAALFS